MLRRHQIDNAIASQGGDIYFYSPEELDGTRGAPGKRNLYVWRNDAVHHVATIESQSPASRIQVTADGKYMALVTKSMLTPYDNAGHLEMYRYDATSRKLICVSCNPDGSLPSSNVEGSQNGLYITSDGRTFFSTQDALVPPDANGIRDVYEYVDGRPQLISTGTGNDEGANAPTPIGLVGVSADGTDAFISTYETLVAQDENGPFLKFYDARVGGGFPFNRPAAPCAAADECHGEGSSQPPLATIGSTASLGASGSAASGDEVRRKRHRHHRKHRHHRRHRRGGKAKR